MSLSPFKSTSQLSSQHPKTPLSLPQALLITAGLAGLVGLSGGVIIRFSLSHSSNARFLSPLQTFPALPSWTLDSPEGGTAASPAGPGGTDTQRANGTETNGAETNGTEANGSGTQSTGTQSTGTQSDQSYTEPESYPATTLDPFVEKNQNNDLSTKSSAEAASVYPEVSSPEDSSPNAPSTEAKYPQNYPTIEAPANGETPYYGEGQQ